MFEDTIFNNDKIVEQKDWFEYAHILIPLNRNPQTTILIWERLFNILSNDKSSLRNSDME
tara:strand:- start:41 stop:220 length:180 start_codon:yes stop_codon:yes gene_type:complete